MSKFPRSTNGAPSPRAVRLPNPWSVLNRWRDHRFQRERQELHSYLEQATPVALLADRLYQEWREAVAEPIQDAQKAANRSATYWWMITEGLRRFESLTPPAVASRYHRLFGEAIWNASQGSEIAKTGFRCSKYSEVSRGLGFLDRYVELMADAEQELGRLLKKYRLVED